MWEGLHSRLASSRDVSAVRSHLRQPEQAPNSQSMGKTNNPKAILLSQKTHGPLHDCQPWKSHQQHPGVCPPATDWKPIEAFVWGS